MSTISLKSIRKSYGKTEVIHGIDAEIADGELIVIVGPSGCGKSTLLRMVAGLETVTSGEIAIDGKRVNELEPMDRNIAMVFQSYALYPHMSVFDNMAYGLKIAGRPKAEIAERVAKAAQMLQLEEFLQRKPRELSGGQRQRVAMGRAIVRKPAAFLFDEPLSNLDAKLRVQMRLEIKGLQRDLGVTSLYVTHDQVEAMTLADRMIVMNAGVAEQIGAPLDVYQDPETVFVGGFIGSPPMNFITPRIFAGNGTALPAALTRAVGSGGEDMLIGLRPEHMALCAADEAMLEGTMRYVEPLGAETLVHVALGDGTQITVRQEGIAEVPEAGAACPMRFDPAYLCLFDGDGKRVRTGA
ncbi:sn-glycerol-3-phosphate ABC transporter ATP-binding protein UgpC [Nitratireductor alexandrii]|uniref:sn-glycerol-3-phosphate ABC transporter ATP-binding protein UgpC n=1 Tax=Nitratireductor alexandrii TaxID=2448161 RepID=UPI000FD797A7|nr:sn-glycerol-3-phosphate ABC transporter ATP-binding protein UgpC [Nitratireductor alexandrii]